MARGKEVRKRTRERVLSWSKGRGGGVWRRRKDADEIASKERRREETTAVEVMNGKRRERREKQKVTTTKWKRVTTATSRLESRVRIWKERGRR